MSNWEILGESFKGSIAYLDNHEGVLTIVGWLFLLAVGLWTQRKYLQNEARMNVYKDLYPSMQAFNKSFSVDLATKIGKFAVTLVIDKVNHHKEGKLYLITGEKLPNAHDYWFKYNSELLDTITVANDSFFELNDQLERWIGVMPDLNNAKNTWSDEVNSAFKKIWEHQRGFMDLMHSNPNDWQILAPEKAEEIDTAIYTIMGYTDDLLNTLVHNELLYPLFGYKKQGRDLRYVKKQVTYSALSKRGIIKKIYRP